MSRASVFPPTLPYPGEALHQMIASTHSLPSFQLQSIEPAMQSNSLRRRAITLENFQLFTSESNSRIIPSGSATLLDTPLELRQEVYRYIFLAREPIDLRSLVIKDEQTWPECKERTAILCVSRQISEEALNVLYGENVFEIDIHHGNHNVVRNFSLANQLRIRRLQVVIRPEGVSWVPSLRLDPTIWPRIFSNLTKLCIVAQQPLRLPRYFSDYDPCIDMNHWLAGLKRALESIRQHISSGLLVEVDDDDREETSEVIMAYFSDGYKKVRTRTGDWFFERDENLLEFDSDYLEHADGEQSDSEFSCGDQD